MHFDLIEGLWALRFNRGTVGMHFEGMNFIEGLWVIEGQVGIIEGLWV